jgi:hypothetical protein
MSKYIYQSNEGETSTMSFQQIQKDWNGTKFYIKILFLMDKLRLSQDEAQRLAKLEFKKIADNYKLQIYQALNY